MNAATRTTLARAGLSAGLIARMADYQRQTARPCPTCHVGSGRTCLNPATGNTTAPHAGRNQA